MTTAPTRSPRVSDRTLAAAAIVLSLVALVLALAVAPPDSVQGQAQRLMYVHVPAACSPTPASRPSW